MEYFPIKRRGGRPPEYVSYHTKIVEGLSKKSDGRYYCTHNDPRTGKRVYFGTKLSDAVAAYKKWLREIKRA
jgi:hypothetical protein